MGTWVAAVAAAACSGPGSEPGPVEAQPSPVAVAAVEPAVEEEPAVVGPAAVAAAAVVDVVVVVPASSLLV